MSTFAAQIGPVGCGVDVRSDFHEQIFARFNEEGIQLPFPLRDLHIRSGVLEHRESGSAAPPDATEAYEPPAT